MDIQLNVNSTVSKEKKAHFSVPKKTLVQPKTSEFSVNFVKNTGFTAKLARKRIIKTTNSAGSNTFFLAKESNIATSSSSPSTAINNPFKISDTNLSSKSHEDVLLAIASSKNEPDISLSLNVINDTTVPARNVSVKKSRMSRTERKNVSIQRRVEQTKLKQTDNTKLEKINKPIKVNKHPRQKAVDSMFVNNPEIPNIGQRFVQPIKEILFTGLPMNSINLHAHLVKTLKDLLEITELTTVQQRTVPVALEGHDVLVRSQTGSGKTLAYALPIIQRLQERQPKINRNDGIFALIIVPTRELAIQTYDLFIKLLKPFQYIVATYLSGGEKRKSEKSRLRKGINILIGTPGRLCDHLLHTESFKLNQLQYLVLDEADRLYEMGYEKDVKMIVDSIKNKSETSATKKIQALLLSATLSPAVKQLAGLALIDPLFIDTSVEKDVKITAEKNESNEFDEAVENAIENQTVVIPSTITQSFTLVPPKQRLVTLCGLVANEAFSKDRKILIFLATENLVDFHYDLLTEVLTKPLSCENNQDIDSDLDDDDNLLGISNDKNEQHLEAFLPNVKFFKLHGSLTQVERSAIFKEFRKISSGILLTTDVSARGIDIPHVDLVIQYSPPHRLSDYVHRVGRTARAGNSGRTILFLSPNEIEYVRILEEKKIRIAQEDYKEHLKGIMHIDSFTTNRLEECASELQRIFEKFIKDDSDIHNKACKAYSSWIKYTSSFPKGLREIFNMKSSNIGHFVKCLGLLEKPKVVLQDQTAPKAQASRNRLTYIERPANGPPRKNVGKSQSDNKLSKFAKRSIGLAVSEFDSGLPAIKKKKRS